MEIYLDMDVKVWNELSQNLKDPVNFIRIEEGMLNVRLKKFSYAVGTSSM